MTDTVPSDPAARPQFNPGRLVQVVMETLGERFGVPTTVDSVSVGPAANAAADLLRALGVTPTTAPRLRSGELSPTERDAFDTITALAPEPAARLAALVDLHAHLTAVEMLNVRRVLDALPDAPEPVDPR